MAIMTLKQHAVWDLPTRIFHWVNFITVVGLIFMGLLMLYARDLGISSIDAKISLKTIHVLIGYLFALNLIWRLVWGFVGGRYSRWSNIVPGRGFMTTLKHYLASIKSGEPQQFLGHNPMGRMAVVVLMLLMMTLAVTGLVRAGTDIYYPPFGSFVAEYIALPNVEPGSLKPYDKSKVDPARFQELKSFKHIYGEIHLYTAYALMLMISFHIAAVVRMEVKEGGSLVSAMFNGRKVLGKRPEDE
ncbi:MAG: cytochrome b/b6 domain-containing protein [Mariprofundus sp.]|nr:cytochrome b/b6 domain-containing protein [Mariprofundus sp.]